MVRSRSAQAVFAVVWVGTRRLTLRVNGTGGTSATAACRVALYGLEYNFSCVIFAA